MDGKRRTSWAVVRSADWSVPAAPTPACHGGISVVSCMPGEASMDAVAAVSAAAASLIAACRSPRKSQTRRVGVRLLCNNDAIDKDVSPTALRSLLWATPGEVIF
eukprot:1329765-Pyramimonas_sp.AAC.2